jgi:hypothetical protein
MRQGLNIALLALAGVLSYVFLLQTCERPVGSAYVDSLKQANEILEVEFTVLKAMDSLQRVQDSAKSEIFWRVHREDRTEIAKLKARPAVIQVRKEFPVIDTLIIHYDTTVFRLERRVADLQVERVGDRQRFNMLLVNSEKRNINLEGINYSLEQANGQLRRTNARQRGWNVVWKGVAIGAGAYAVFKK